MTHNIDTQIFGTRTTLAVELELGKRIQKQSTRDNILQISSSSTSECSCHECQSQRITLFSSQCPEQPHCPQKGPSFVPGFADSEFLGPAGDLELQAPESAVLSREFFHLLGPRDLQDRKWAVRPDSSRPSMKWQLALIGLVKECVALPKVVRT